MFTIDVNKKFDNPPHIIIAVVCIYLYVYIFPVLRIVVATALNI